MTRPVSAAHQNRGGRVVWLRGRSMLTEGDQTEKFPEEVHRFIDGERWTYAKTMPDWPHEYLVRELVDQGLFERMVLHIRSNGYVGHFYRREITYYEEAGLVYWTMGAPLEETTIVNRCRKEDSFEARSKNGTLPKNQR